jgi:HAD superfamily hydrolase (TIGR01509 family)
MYDSYLFDLDGVLIDSEHVNVAAATKTLKDLGMPITEAEKESVIGRSTKTFMPSLLEARHVEKSEWDGIIATNRQNYDTLWKGAVLLMPGVEQTLRAMRARPVSLAIGTTNRRIVVDRFIDQFGFGGYFSVIVTSENVTHHKPDPEVYTKALALLGTNPARTLVIEDTAIGVAAAKNAGLPCVAVPNRYSSGQDFAQADFVRNSILGILDL